jgi:diacylglycerol kinase (ATP)
VSYLQVLPRPLATPTPRRRALLLHNPNSRRGAEVLGVVLEHLGDAGIDVAAESYEDPAEVSPDIVRRRDGMDMVIVCGGDGSLNAAAKGLLETGLPLGIVPSGTGNDLARSLGIPLDIARAADVIAAGHTRRIDVGEVNGHPFFNVASLGLSVDLARKLTRETKRRWGRLGYALAAARVLLSARRVSATIVDRTGAVDVETLQIAVGNGRHYGGGNVVEQTATIDDRHLDLYSLELDSVWKLPLMLRSFRAGTHGAWREVRTIRCTEFVVHTREPEPINADGELVTTTPAHFKIRPAALTVFAP